MIKGEKGGKVEQVQTQEQIQVQAKNKYNLK
jgi:hypothetical protein